MGFDNECILNIQSLAGEYFCPVCRLLVYPNEALQSQCTHLYCKPCLSYVVSTTKACPYDGYLVTEADSKPLIESNKPLAETIGKIEVHCLYHRSGCPWKGPLSDCTTHCSGCAFGNSPVVCNRCGVQIVHRQVQDHAQNCPGVQSQAQPIGGIQSKSATAASADQTKVATQPGTGTSQALPLQGISTPGQGQNQNQQAGSINNPQSTAQVTSDNWYHQQQQYPQYYQPYAGYDPYQQYNPYQQQAVQQYQQHQGHAYPPTASAVQTLQSTQAQSQTQLQHHAQAQPLSQPQPTQSSVQLQTQPQSHVNVQPAVTQQLQPHLSIPSLSQMQPHTHQTTQGHPQPQPQPHHHSLPLPQSHSMQPYQQQQQPILPYQQSQSQMQQLQPQAPQPTSQLPVPQPHLQGQPPMQVRLPTQQYQPAITSIQTPVQHPSALPMVSHQSYPQIQGHQQVQLAAPQHMAHTNPQTGPSQHVQHVSHVHAQLPQQPMHTRPSQPQGVVPNHQPPALLPSTVQPQNMPSTQQQLVLPPQQQGYLGHHHPYMQSNQQGARPPQLVPQQSSNPQQQLHMPMNAQLRPQGLPVSQNQSTVYLQSQQTGMPPYHSQVGPSMSNINVLPQSVSSARNGVPDGFQVKATEVVGNQKYASRANLQSLPEQQSANSQFEDKHLTGKSISGQGVKAPEQQVYKEEANASVAISEAHVDSVETNVSMSETDPKLREDKPGKDKATLNGTAGYATGVAPELHVLGNGESTINQVMKHGAGDGTWETVSGNPQHDSNGLHDEAKHPSFLENARPKADNHDRGSLASHYGPSSAQQKSLSGQTHAEVPRNPHHQFMSPNADTFLPPGGISGPRPERGPGQPPAHRNFEISSHPGLYNPGFPGAAGSSLGTLLPGSVDSHSGMTGRAQPPGLDGGRVARVGELHNLKRYPTPSNVDSELVPGAGNYFPSSRTDDRFPHKFGMDPISRNSDKGSHGFINDTQLRNAGERLLPGGFAEDNMGRPNFPHPDYIGPDTGYGHYPTLASRNPHADYPGAFTHGISPGDRSGRDIGVRNSHRFGEESRPFSLHSESREFPFHEKRFPNMPPHLRRGEHGSNMNMQMGDNVPPRPSHMLRSGDLIGQDPLPSHFHRGEHFGPNRHLRFGEPSGFGAFSDHSHRIGDMPRIGNFPTRHGEAGFRSIYYSQDSSFFMGEESFENTRKRKSAASMGWCRICKVDCETVEGLDVHSQTREHQRKSMDMVLKIKQKNAKKQKLNCTDRSSVEELKESRIGGFEGQGDKR